MSTIQDLIDYVRETPENTNPAVIRTIAQNLENDDVITVTFTFDAETEEWESDWTFDDLYTELSKNTSTIWDDGHSVNIKVTDQGGYHESRAFPVVRSSETASDRLIELWSNYGTILQEAELTIYNLKSFKYQPDGEISFDTKALIDQQG